MAGFGPLASGGRFWCCWPGAGASLEGEHRLAGMSNRWGLCSETELGVDSLICDRAGRDALLDTSWTPCMSLDSFFIQRFLDEQRAGREPSETLLVTRTRWAIRLKPSRRCSLCLRASADRSLVTRAARYRAWHFQTCQWVLTSALCHRCRHPTIAMAASVEDCSLCLETKGASPVLASADLVAHLVEATAEWALVWTLVWTLKWTAIVGAG